jgi:hypothetical protein
MDSVIIQEAKIFDPRTLPSYIGELSRWDRALIVNILSGKSLISDSMEEKRVTNYSADATQLFDPEFQPVDLPEGPSAGFPSEKDETVTVVKFNEILTCNTLVKALYPALITHLERLNITEITDFVDLQPPLKPIEGIATLEELGKNLGKLGGIWPRFKAKIKADFPLGTDEAIIEMAYSSFDNIEPEPRSITVSSIFENAYNARIGLKNLIKLYPEMLLEETLFAFKLPEPIRELHGKSRAYLDETYNYEHGFSSKKPESEYDSEVYHTLRKTALLKHLGFAAPNLSRAGIIPIGIKYYDDSTEIKMPVESFEEITDVIRQPSYSKVHLPEVQALFGDAAINIDFGNGNGTHKIYAYDMMSVAITSEKDGTLEDIMSRIQERQN